LANYKLMMKFLNHILPVVILIPLFTVCNAQHQQEYRLKIESLKKALPVLKDSARVDYLNELSDLYLSLNSFPDPDTILGAKRQNTEAAIYFDSLAHEEAININYVHGVAEALSVKGEIQVFLDNLPAEEKFSKEAILWYNKTTNKKRLAKTYMNLGFAIYGGKSLYAEAMKNLDTALRMYRTEGDLGMIAQVYYISGYLDEDRGDYQKAFEDVRESLRLAKQNKDEWFMRIQLARIGSMFWDIGDDSTALGYFRQAFQNLKPERIKSLELTTLINYAELLSFYKHYDSAKYYYKFADTSNEGSLRFYLASTGRSYFSQRKYKNALADFLRALKYARQFNDHNQVMSDLIRIGDTYLAMENNNEALVYARQGLELAKKTGTKQLIMDGYKIIYSVYDSQRQPDSAYFYYKLYNRMKDSVINNRIKNKLAGYQSEQKIELLNNRTEIQQQNITLLNKEKEIQQVQLQKKSFLRNILVASIVLLLILAVVVFRNISLKRKYEAKRREYAENELYIQKLESNKTKAELQQQSRELEMQALRAQMNPHFIFNSLNSINRFILQNDRTKASEYLTKFSKLVRMILQNSQASLITLESELNALELYLNLESVRFDFHFDYKICIPKDLDIEALKVPPSILQPYVENAIWHGLMHKEEKGHLNIEISEGNDQLIIKIADDGIGRNQAAALSSKSATKHKSMGLKITADRIALLQASNEIKSTVIINDLVNARGSAAGTEVIIKLPVIYD